jgi:hypothetical protein
MRLPRITLLALALPFIHAYDNASPFFVLSSDPYVRHPLPSCPHAPYSTNNSHSIPDDAPLKRAQIALSEDIESRLIKTLSACDKKSYYIFSQASVTADDLRHDRMPKLQKALGSVDGSKFLGIPDLVDDGFLKSATVAEGIDWECRQVGKKVRQAEEGECELYKLIVQTEC